MPTTDSTRSSVTAADRIVRAAEDEDAVEASGAAVAATVEMAVAVVADAEEVTAATAAALPSEDLAATSRRARARGSWVRSDFLLLCTPPREVNCNITT